MSLCSCLLSNYLNLFNIIVYKVYSNGKPKISSYGRKASIREFYDDDDDDEAPTLCMYPSASFIPFGMGGCEV
ncbi:hypothetical protein K1719_046751 [Acacia pycnantha]|nr:hypothetical protein K1719_046751 [Acacia pycnantha]